LFGQVFPLYEERAGGVYFLPGVEKLK